MAFPHTLIAHQRIVGTVRPPGRPSPVTTAWDWQMQAACRDLDSAVFFHPDRGHGHATRQRVQHAKAVCRGCPVIDACRRYALTVQEPYGVWGGLTVTERSVLLRHPGQITVPGA